MSYHIAESIAAGGDGTVGPRTLAMMVTVLRPRAVVVLCVAAASATAADPQRARVACDAQFSLPCARTNSEYLAWATARQFAAAVAGGTPAADVLEQITAGQFNMDSGFYPFVFEAATSRLVAHGERSSLVGHDLQYALDELHLQYVSADALHARFVAAANTADGEWVQYLWPTRLPDGSYTATSKMSYVVGVNREDGGLLCLGVGFPDSPFSPGLPCWS
eukprot:COSAG06_NODE_16646_length_989_cov_0.895506_1_plen_219_part_10